MSTRDPPQPDQADSRTLRRVWRTLRSRDADGRARRARGRLLSRPSRSAFHLELDSLLKDFAGRPTPLYFASRLTRSLAERRFTSSAKTCSTPGAHKINNCIGQGLLARRMGKNRIIAETGAGQHGVATATVCALFGMECVIYMGEEDMRRQELECLPYEAARRGGPRRQFRLEDAQRRHQRGDARLGH